MRYLLVEAFVDWLKADKPSLSRIAVVGGSTLDPEIAELKKLYPLIDVDVFGIDNTVGDSNFFHLDLNQENNLNVEDYDLVLCSQVLEHIWNLENAFNSLVKLSKSGSYLWLNCPASNIPHGSPDYYSAGYTSDFLAKNLEIKNFEILSQAQFGSKRNYFMTHALRQWVGRHEHDHPVLGYEFKPGTFLGVSRKYIRETPGRILSAFLSKKVLRSLEYATESVVLAKFKAS